MITTNQARDQRIEGTVRVEAFSDGVMAIVITLLIFEVHVPALTDFSQRAVLKALLSIAPKAISFAISFFTVAIFWVNHHHIFSMVTHTNWKLLWYNNMLFSGSPLYLSPPHLSVTIRLNPSLCFCTQ